MTDIEIKEWDYDAAVSKALDLLNLSKDYEKEVEREVWFAVGGDKEDPISQDRLEYALRRTVSQGVRDVTEDTLRHALLRLYLEIEDAEIPASTSEELSLKAHERLEILVVEAKITETQSTRAQFYYVTGKCNLTMVRLIRQHGIPMVALSHGLSTNEITEGEARIAAFCLLTNNEPCEARHQKADQDLAEAVRSSLGNSMNLAKHSAKYIEALLFPVLSSEDIERALIKYAAEGSGLSSAREKYLVEFFKKQNACESDATAKSMLQQNNWSVQVAGRAYRQQFLARPPLSHAETYDTTNPPFVEANSIVIGLLGTVDRSKEDEECPDLASPESDGWFISDFYLWKHVLKDMGSEQTWVTCLDPEYLYKKYVLGGHGAIRKWPDGYVHGRATAERVVVLDQQTLPFAKQDLTLCEETSVVDDYLAILEKKFADAEEKGKPVVLLMFSHGDIDNCGDKKGGLQIGIAVPWEAQPTDFLTADKIAAVHSRHPKVKLTLFMTSCYSGYWVATPYFQASDVNIIAGAREWEQTHSWKKSSSMRHAGGVFSTGFLEELEQEPSDMSQEQNAREYSELTRALAARLEGLSVDEVSKGLASLPSFTAPETYEKFYQRSGYALHQYKENYDRLTRVQPSQKEGPFAQTGGSNVGSYGRSTKGLAQAVRWLVGKYEQSFPTQTNQDYQLEQQLRKFRDGELDDETKLRALQAQLAFRNAKCDLAYQIVYKMELFLGLKVHISEWDPHQDVGKERRERMNKIATKLRTETNWFKSTEKSDGPTYDKPFLYVANALTLHDKNDEEISLLTTQVKQELRREVSAGSKRVRGDRSWNEVMKEHREKKVKGSPSKGKRASLHDFLGAQENAPHASGGSAMGMGRDDDQME